MFNDFKVWDDGKNKYGDKINVCKRGNNYSNVRRNEKR